MTDNLTVLDQGKTLEFSFEDALRYHGPLAPGGVAHAYQVLARALEVLSADGPVERRALVVTTAHGGPGVRDTFELVTRGVTEGRYTVNAALARKERGTTLANYVFQIEYRNTAITVVIRDDGFVVDEYISLSRVANRTPEQEARLVVVKQEMADRVMAQPAAQVYDVEPALATI
ncbi:hypothetical protein [Rhodococcus sp. ARC_M6]|uniref:hypothetical protein n=1 Tax=Rhodococcus sp. ARC_M6 TaxID=2928852 RepID=UPI001FB4DE2B|nr:hypothetical protein [Rhodococcus sp. ARC_M6]MCJ0907447.1 hypothetical protein [Rhodococcus sp. ARC_M6]